MRILIVEDEVLLRMKLVDSFEAAGFNVVHVGDGEEGLFSVSEDPLDIAIIDLSLPRLSGLEIIRRLRARKNLLPVIVLSARDHWQVKVEALNVGADDYVTKPCEFEELLSRVHVLLRRSNGWLGPELSCPPIRLHMKTRAVTVDGAPVDLTRFEYRVLEHLMLQAGQVVSKTALEQRLYGEEHEPEYNAIDTLIARLRKKLDPEGVLMPIATVRGRGYRFALARDIGSSVARSSSSGEMCG